MERKKVKIATPVNTDTVDPVTDATPADEPEMQLIVIENTSVFRWNFDDISPTYIVWGSGLVFMECESSTVVSTSGAIATFNLTYPLTVSATGNGSIYPVASGAPCPVSLAVGARSATGITITAQRADGSAIVSGQLLIQAFCVNFLAGSSLLG